MKNGWHMIMGFKIYVEDNKVLRGIDDNRTVYPYRWDNRLKCWNECSGISVSAFRKGLNEERMKMA